MLKEGGSHSRFRYTIEKTIGEGAFGTVYLINSMETGEHVALKRICEDTRYKSRELQILQMLHHPNCISLLHHFTSESANGKITYSNLITEYVPDDLLRVERQYLSIGQTIPIFLVKLISYQLLRSLAYLHSKKIVHRDIKPANILLYPTSCALKLCDFGSAKFHKVNEQSISYITCRPYRAPELVIGGTRYGPEIDIWSAGCVIAEMLLGQPLFYGENNAEQLFSIIQILGTPSKSLLLRINPSLQNTDLPITPPLKWESAFRASTDKQAIDLVSKLCCFDPNQRLKGYEMLLHPFFDELRDPATKMPNGKEMPPLFEFTNEEVSYMGIDLIRQLVPPRFQMESWFVEGVDTLAVDAEE